MSNVNDYRKGQQVVTLGSAHRRRALDFPGWGAPNAADFLLPTPAGMVGTVTSVESHGSFPYTRYSVKFEDGSSASGLEAQTDFRFTR